MPNKDLKVEECPGCSSLSG